MKKEDAKRAIYKVLREYAKDHDLREQGAGLTFYAWLTKHHPDLVRFKCHGTPNQQVKIWFDEFVRQSLLE
jgi:hypothetical protein